MAYDEDLAQRVRAAMGTTTFTEIKMFGGLCFTVGGNMAIGIVGDDLMVRLTPRDGDAALAKPHVRPMDFSGRPMSGFIYVGPDGLRTQRMLQTWVDRGTAFAASLPPKKPKPKKPRVKR